MFVKIINDYRDNNMNLTLIPKNVILEVTEARANELIEGGVAEAFTFAVPVQAISSSVVCNEKILNEKEEIEVATTANPEPVKLKLNGKTIVEQKTTKNTKNK